MTAMSAPTPNWAASRNGAGRPKRSSLTPTASAAANGTSTMGRPTTSADHQAGEDSHAAQVGHGRLLGLERPGAIHDAEAVGEHDAQRARRPP